MNFHLLMSFLSFKAKKDDGFTVRIYLKKRHKYLYNIKT